MNPTVRQLVLKPRDALISTIRSEDTILLALAIVVGLFSGLGAVGFIELIKLFRQIFWSPLGGVFTGFTPGDLKVLLIPLLPALGVWLCRSIDFHPVYIFYVIPRWLARIFFGTLYLLHADLKRKFELIHDNLH